MRIIELANLPTLLLDIVAWAVIHTGTGYAAHRLPVGLLERDGWVFRARPFEDGGRFYRRRLRIAAWKDRVPEAGALFAGGISKAHLPDEATGGLERFVVETRRAELGHWWAAAAGPLFILWNPPVAAVLLVLYGLAANLPCIAIQRYNRLRATRVLRRRAPGLRSRAASPDPDGRRAERGSRGSSIP